ncbi:MAG: membrane protein insertase YidC [Candidatus Latescibacteria bacterium]|nr:membrane protein insertase YidC [Candidatus Latescibacterota bacterium]
MDKKTILALVLMGLVILLMGRYQKRPTPQRTTETTKQEQPTVDGETERRSMSATPLPAVSTPEGISSEPVLSRSFPAPDYTPERIVLENEYVRGVISTEGGTVRSWRLKTFRGKEGIEDVQLLAEESRGLSLSIWNQEVGAWEDLSNVEWKDQSTSDEVRLVADLGAGQRIEKIFVLPPNAYHAEMKFLFNGFESDTRTRLAWRDGMAVTEKNIKDDVNAMQVRTYMGGEVEKYDLKKGKALHSASVVGALDWVCLRNKYFAIALIPAFGRETTFSVSGPPWDGVSGKRYDVFLESTIGAGHEANFTVYLGPQSYADIAALGVGLEHAMDLGWRWIRPIGKVMLSVLTAMHRVISNYGIVIILFSILIKLVVYPLTHSSYKSTNKMQEIQPLISELKEKYKGDAQRLNKETMKLYKEYGVNPVGGCLPMLLQMPILFSLFTVFRNTIEFRQAGFIPGWIEDLAQPDPFYILPVLMGLTMFIQQKMTMKDPKQAAMVYIMPIMMVFFFIRFSSGLVLYYTLFNVLSALQQWLMKRHTLT